MTVTANTLSKSIPVCGRTRIWSAFLATFILFVAVPFCVGQTALTGALNGLVTDSSGALVSGAQVVLTNQAAGEARTATTGNDGRYNFSLVAPGTYRVDVTKSGFKSETYSGVQVAVTETAVLNAHLSIGATNMTVTVTSDQELLQTDTSALGRTVDSDQVTGLPLVARTFTQILALSPGVTTPLTDASELGRGSSASSGGYAGAKTVNGARPSDNNFEMNGIPINDNLGVGSNSVLGAADAGGGIPTPNPDTIQEFKVQTAQYDASFGRDAGADVNIVTKTGSNAYHGTVFEFFRNEALNANNYILNSVGAPRGVLRQNQYGFALGGPIVRDKLLGFGSYQGTRQLNGITSGCSGILYTPPITNDRSAAGLGAVFAGRTGELPPGVTDPLAVQIAANGSNISPIALAIFQYKNPIGSYLIPTPQHVNTTLPFDRQGISTFDTPCTYNENQFMTNVQYNQSPRSQFAIRYFQLLSNQNLTMGGSVPIASPSSNWFRDASLTHTFVFTPRLVNELVFGWNQATVEQPIGQDPSMSSLGANVPSDFGPATSLIIETGYSVSPQSQTITNQPNYALVDSIAYSRGKHTIRFGGMADRNYFSMGNTQLGTSLYFLSTADLLLGLPGGFGPGENGEPISNVLASFGGILVSERQYLRVNGALYIQDDYKATQRLTLNLGARYDRLGALGDQLGRSSTFNPATANPDPTTPSYAGYVVAGNYRGPALPTGVVKTNHSYAIDGDNQNAFSPRFGFAYQILPQSSRVIVRGGFGMYNSEPPVWTVVTSEIGPPWFYNVAQQGTINTSISLQSPYGPGPFLTLSQIPQFTPYSTTAPIGQLQFTDVHFRVGYAEVYNLNLQADLGHSYMAEIGYVGTKGIHLSQGILPNLALPAPFNGVTTNTVANIQQRVPYLGFTPAALVENRTEGSSNYNGLQASLTKRYNDGLQFLASYTFSKTLDANGVDVIEAAAGTSGDAVGNNLAPRADYGRTNFDRPHRFVVSYLYDLPGLKNGTEWQRQILNRWQLAGVTTIQSGPALTITATNTYNAFGQTNDFAPLSGTCHGANYMTSGSKAAKVAEYFNMSCFKSSFPVIGSDGLATNYANGGVGVTNAPGQHNWDIALVKRFDFIRESNTEFRTEFFNAFNHAQLGAPSTSLTSAGFGDITSVSANPRIIQFALKINF